MRLCTALPLCLAMATAALLPASPAHARFLPGAHALPAAGPLPAAGFRPASGLRPAAGLLPGAGLHRAVGPLPAAGPRLATGPRPAAVPLAAADSLTAAHTRPAFPARVRTEADADPDSGCVGASDRDFPLTTRIHGGPDTYVAGGGFGIWYLDLTNTARGTCTAVHPVVVLADDQRALRPAQPELDFYDGSRPLPVRLEATDEKELVGVFDADGFDGFTVAPGKTLTVKVRLAFSGDAVPNRITASAAVVRREGEDGEWVGESAGYRFAIGDGGSPVEETPLPSASPSRLPSGQTSSPGPDAVVGGDEDTGRPTSAPPTAPEAGDPASGTSTAEPSGLPDPSASGTGAAATAPPFGEDAQQAGQAPDELAATGSAARTARTEAVLGAAAVALAGLGTGLLLVARRRR